MAPAGQGSTYSDNEGKGLQSTEKVTGIPKYDINKELNKKVEIVHGDITTLKVDAIVNAANKQLTLGAGVNGAIHKAAGSKLLAECEQLRWCNTGSAKITKAYDLPVLAVIHTVGPRKEIPAKLEKCYHSCLDLLVHNNMRTIAFPCISTGIYGYRSEKAVHVALNAVRKWLETNSEKVDKVIFCVYKEEDMERYTANMNLYFPQNVIVTNMPTQEPKVCQLQVDSDPDSRHLRLDEKGTENKEPSEADLSTKSVRLNNEVGLSMLINASIGGKDSLMIIDTAAQITMISETVWRQSDLCNRPYEILQVKNAQQGAYMECKILRDVDIVIDARTYTIDIAVGPISDDALLGMDFMYKFNCIPWIAKSEFVIDGHRIPAVMKRNGEGYSYQVSKVQVARTTTVPPGHAGLVQIALTNPVDADFVVKPSLSETWRMGSGIVKGKNTVSEVEIINDSTQPVTLRRGQLISDAEELDCIIQQEEKVDVGMDQCTTTDSTIDGKEGSGVISDTDHEEMNGSEGTLPDRYEPLPGDPPLLSPTLIPDPDSDVNYLKAKFEEVKQKIPDFIRSMYDEGCTHLKLHEKIALGLLLIRYCHVFSKNKKDLGLIKEIKHIIKTFNEEPVREKLRRTPMKYWDEEEAILWDMFTSGVIRQSSSDWASAPVLCRKKSGDIRYTVDYRKLNMKTVRDQYPLPLIDECMLTLTGRVFYHGMDLANGYWQVEIDEKDRHKTAFLTRFGLFEHVRMAQGLCNSPATFQRVMNLVFKGLLWREVITFLDDLISGGSDFLHALVNLERILQRAERYNLKYKPSKCHLFATKMEALGRVLCRDGVAMTEHHVNTIKQWPRPKTAQEAERFTGFVNYHREFIGGLAELLRPLYELTKLDKDSFVWTQECEDSFNKLKEAMSSTPVLAFPTKTGRFLLDTDASDTAIGAGLYQEQNGVLRPISFASATLTKEQRRYCTTRKELLAVVYFTRHFRHYLLGREFDVRTDHASLIWLCRFKDPQGQLGRWLEELAQYSMVIQHRAGKLHQNADALSRLPSEAEECEYYESGKDVTKLPCGGCTYCSRLHNQWRKFEEEVDYVIPLAARPGRIIQNKIVSVKAVTVEPDEVNGVEETDTLPDFMEHHSPETLREAQLRDVDLRMVMTWLENDTRPTIEQIEQESIEARVLWRLRHQLVWKDGVLFYEWLDPVRNRLKLIVPHELKESVIATVHDNRTGGHWGRDKTVARLKQSFFWPSMNRDCKQFVDTCAKCHVNKYGRDLRRELEHYQAGTPGERVHLDFLGPFTTSVNGNKYILSMIDQFTKWVELCALPDQTAPLTAEVFFQQWIARFGVPLKVHTDQGRNFESNLFTALCETLEAIKTRTTRHRPSSNGQVERYNQMILSYIRCFLADKPEEWDKHLATLGMSLRATVNRSTGYTANMLRLGQEVNMPEDLLFGVTQANHGTTTAPEYVQDLWERLRVAFEQTRENMKTAQRRQKTDYDLRAKLRQRQFDVGDLVYTKNCSHIVGISRKLQPILKGPYVVLEVITPALYRLRDQKRDSVHHHDKMRICEDREIPLWVQRVRQEILTGPQETVSDAGTAASSAGKPQENANDVGIAANSTDGPQEGTVEVQDMTELPFPGDFEDTILYGDDETVDIGVANSEINEVMMPFDPDSEDTEVQSTVVTPLKLHRRGRKWQVDKEMEPLHLRKANGTWAVQDD